MTSNRKIEAFLQREIDIGTFPGAAYAFGSYGSIRSSGAVGRAVAVPLKLAVTNATIFDCASITKPLVTGALVMQAVAEGKIRLDDEFEGHVIRDLLTHTSGLKAWLPLYAMGDYLEAIREHGRETDAGKRVIYSDLNFVVLYYLIQSVFAGYADAARGRVFGRLRLMDSFFVPPARLKPRIAATEWSQRWEVAMCEQRKVSFKGFRRGLIWGETHDGNSHHNGGTAGNAGLFSTAADVYRIAQGWVNGKLVTPELLEEATRNYTAGMEENRGLGWQLSSPGHSSTGVFSERAFGHTGFTGTSVWIDPDRKCVMVLLTNRVHPIATSVAMQRARGRFHELALAALK